MKYSSLQIQSLIRKYKNGVKEILDEKKILRDYTYHLNTTHLLKTKDFFKDNNDKTHKYNIHDIMPDKIINKQKIALIPKKTINTHNYNVYTDTNKLLYSMSPGEHIQYVEDDLETIPEERIFTLDKEDYMLYTGNDGILHSLYNTEFCNENWLMAMYFINRIFNNFVNDDKIIINSLHINGTDCGILSALHHFLKNSKIKNIYKINEWLWLLAIKHTSELRINGTDRVYKKYKNNFLNLYNMDVYTVENLNFIMNETIRRRGKINFLCIGITTEKYIHSFIYNALISIKLLDTKSILYIELPLVEKWDLDIINGIILFSLLFEDLYIFNFKLSDTSEKYLLICKNKKKINIACIYNKLLNILTNGLSDNNLFSKEFLLNEMNDITHSIIEIITKRNLKPIIFTDMLYEMDKVLEFNEKTFV